MAGRLIWVKERLGSIPSSPIIIRDLIQTLNHKLLVQIHSHLICGCI